jgi:ubiquinone/menaquinone biosynthesis C-methylase UbiE
MAEKARDRLGKAPNVSLSVEDGQRLSFADQSFDAVLCNLGLMFFPDPVRGLSEFCRVLRPGGRVAVSVNTVVERSRAMRSRLQPMTPAPNKVRCAYTFDGKSCQHLVASKRKQGLHKKGALRRTNRCSSGSTRHVH